MRAIGIWLTGMGILQAGWLLVRLLVGLVPQSDWWLDPPFWSVGVTALAGVAYVLVGRGVRAGRRKARAAGVALVGAWIVVTLVSINTDTLATQLEPSSRHRIG